MSSVTKGAIKRGLLAAAATVGAVALLGCVPPPQGAGTRPTTAAAGTRGTTPPGPVASNPPVNSGARGRQTEPPVTVAPPNTRQPPPVSRQGNPPPVSAGGTRPGPPPSLGRVAVPPGPAAPPSGGSNEADTLRNELKNRYGVTLVGTGINLNSIKVALEAARQFQPAQVGPLEINLTSENRASGILGVYWSDRVPFGRIILYDTKTLHVALHEIAHHMTLVKRTDVAKSIERAVYPDGLPRLPVNLQPSRYAMSQPAEFLAEWTSIIRERTKNLATDRRFSLASFQPSTEHVRITSPIYAP